MPLKIKTLKYVSQHILHNITARHQTMILVYSILQELKVFPVEKTSIFLGKTTCGTLFSLCSVSDFKTAKQTKFT